MLLDSAEDKACSPCASKTVAEQYLQISESAIFAAASNGLLSFANKKCCQLLGHDEYELIGRDWASILLTRKNRRLARKYFADTITGEAGLSDYCETLVPTSGGEVRTVAWQNATLLRDGSGNVMGFAASLTDITEHKKILKRLQNRERLYTLVAENAQGGIWTCDLNPLRMTYISPSIEKVSGFAKEEVVGQSFDRMVTPASYKRGVAELKRHIAIDREYNGRPHTWTIELEHFHKDGTTVYVEVQTSIIRDAQGNPTSIVGTTRDITERKQAERALQESEKRYRSFFENSMDATCIIGRNGDVLEVNRTALALFGFSKEQLVREGYAHLVPREQRRKFQRQIEQCGYVHNFEMQIRRGDGVLLDCLLNFDLSKDDSGNIVGYEGSVRDISEYKRLQANLHRYINEVAKAQEEERLRLSHELHDGVLQDLLALSLKVEQAIRREGRPHEEKAGQLQVIREEVNRLAKDMRTLSHALRPSVLDQLGLVAAVQTLLSHINEDTGVKTYMQVNGTERRLDPELELALFRIFQEALNNVRQHSQAQSVQVSIHFGTEFAKVSISDDGKGFEVPRRLSDLASKGKLGLIGMQERVSILGGQLHLESRPTAGTSITVRTPYVRPHEPPES